ncbi:hypothetical protein LSCM1_07602 [Leishmania martiniquensis]|uniref:Kinetoplast-associated protein-like protein n=1 Tax=Leishmania martiniquensis TaxID=1580590 RepID=A0A836HWF4_9TRYP|nr:hypothetical protein LSCM1_07602 [Leishmania martiniquensis]
MKQQLAVKALYGPVRALPPPPPATAGAERAPHHTETSTEKKEETVAKGSPDELRRIIVEDVAMVCQVPNHAMTRDVVQSAIEAGALPTVMSSCEQSKRARDSLDAELTCQPQQAEADVEKALDDRESQLRAAQDALKDERVSYWRELREAQPSAAVRDKNQQHERVMAAEKACQHALAIAEARAWKADAALVEALSAQLGATEAATNFCKAALESQRAEAAVAGERRAARLAAVVAIRTRIEDFCESCIAADAEDRCQLSRPSAAEKEALTRDLITQLEGVKREQAAIKDAAARAQCLPATVQQHVVDAEERAAQQERARRAAHEKLHAVVKMMVYDASGSATEAELVNRINVQHQEALVGISELVFAASAALESASEALATHHQQRAAEPRQEEALIAKMFCEGDGRLRHGKGSDLAAQVMRDVYEAATGGFLHGWHQWAWVNLCLGALLLLSLATPQCKKYRVR